MKKPFLWLALASLFTSAAAPAWAQSDPKDYPTKPIRMVTSTAGSGSDFVMRLMEPGLSSGLGQRVIIDNRGGGAVPIEIAVKAPPDGYTYIYYGSTLWLLPLMQNASYDALRDFVPVSLTVSSSYIVTVNASLPVKSIKDLIALAKAKPGALNYGASGPSGQVSAELFKALAGVDLVGVPYKSAAQVLNALLAGEVQVFITAAGGGLAPHMNSGKIRALAVTSAKRSTSFPTLPTVAEAGLPGYEFGQAAAVFAPAKTPAVIVDRFSKEVARVVNQADLKEKFSNIGTDAVGSTPQEAAAMIKSEITRLGKVIKDAKIRLD